MEQALSHGLADTAVAAASFLRTRWRAACLRTRADVEAHQKRRIAAWLAGPVARVKAFRKQTPCRLGDMPITDKASVMARLEDYNALGLSAPEIAAMMARREHPPRHLVGASTGTSGNRSWYVISLAERQLWLGAILAKTLPRFPFETARVAVALPVEAPLYAAADRGRLLSLRFFDLGDGLDTLPRRMAAYGPDTLIAPPSTLRYLAHFPDLLRPKRVFSGAEVLDPIDHRAIEAAFGVKVREIYMAAEGLLGVSCRFGTMHLAEDAMHFELQKAADGLVSPVITDFSRGVQITARYRMNDLLRLAEMPCACGSPLQAVAEIVGRSDDMFRLPGAAGQVEVAPGAIRNAITGAHASINDFRCVQDGPSLVGLWVDPLAAFQAARAGLAAAFVRAGCRGEIALLEGKPQDGRKLRRVWRRWRET
ncbi:adenylate synthase [Planctomycetia bacterium]|nr:adenylate synthase [Planctomycetia bacterium]